MPRRKGQQRETPYSDRESTLLGQLGYNINMLRWNSKLLKDIQNNILNISFLLPRSQEILGDDLKAYYIRLLQNDMHSNVHELSGITTEIDEIQAKIKEIKEKLERK